MVIVNRALFFRDVHLSGSNQDRPGSGRSRAVNGPDPDPGVMAHVRFYRGGHNPCDTGRRAAG